MDSGWTEWLLVNPLPYLRSQMRLTFRDPALEYWVCRDLLDDKKIEPDCLWESERAVSLLRRQQTNGSWRYPGKSSDPLTSANYDLLETYRNLRILVEMFGFDRRHPAIQNAANYIFSCQTSEGDVRGILGNQYMPYYHGAILELLIKAGYASDAQIVKGLEWLLSMRQMDEGWVVPAQLVPAVDKTQDFWLGALYPPERSKPSSHLATGMALRAFAASPEYRERAEVRAAANLLKGRLFQVDKYNDRKAVSYWFKFQYPFWWTNLLTALDTLYWLGFRRDDGEIAHGLAWFKENQTPDGLWETGYGAGKSAEENRLWVGLAACRMVKNYIQNN